jgi:hypothetical protein
MTIRSIIARIPWWMSLPSAVLAGFRPTKFGGTSFEVSSDGPTHPLAQLLLDELQRVESAVAEESVEGERRVDLPHVFEVLLRIGDEDLVEFEAHERQTAQAGALGEQLADVVPVDLGGPLEGEVRDAEPFQLRGVARPGVPANVMAGGLEVHRNAGERVEVAVERHGGEKNFHESISLLFTI